MEFPSYGSLIDSTATFYRERFRRVLLYSVAQLVCGLLLLVSFVPWALLAWLTWGNPLSLSLALLGLLLSFFALLPILSVFPIRMLATEEGFGAALSAATTRWWPTFTTGSWSVFFILGALVCFGLPAIVLFVWFAWNTMEMAIGDKSGLAALDKSRAMSRGNFWQVLFWIILLAVVFGAASVLLGLLPGGSVISWLLVNPLLVVGQLVLYDALKDAPESDGMTRGEWAFAGVVGVLGNLVIMALLAVGVYFAIQKMPELVDKFQQAGGFPKLFDAIKVVPKS